MFCTDRIVIAVAPLVLALGVLASPAGLAAPSNEVQDAQQNCDGSKQDRAACLREAGAAAQERRRGGLTNPAPQQQQDNAQARCADQLAASRADCEARMQGAANSKAEGSVAGGGIIRETVTPASAPR